VAAAKKKGYDESARVDVHAHHLVPSYRAALTAAGITAIGGIPIPDWSPELAIKFMDLHGIAVQFLSVSDPGVSFVADDAAANALARQTNTDAAAVVKAHPKRFGAFAVVNLRDPAGAAAEVTYALDTLKLDGIGLLSSAAGRYLGDPADAPLLAELDRRKAWVFVHPTAVAADDMPSYAIPNFIAEYPFDTTRAFISLLFNGAFVKYPHIRWHFGHAGGTVPMLRARLVALADSAKQFGPLLGLPAGASVLTASSPTKALKKSFYDTALVADPPALEAAVAMADTGQILFGSDWPFASRLYTDKVKDPAPALSEVFTNDVRTDIDRRNARGQLPRAAKLVPKR
jgi:predicted TIM-barrel fold metal-dependent hydrolase